jgi:uncharacterized membrane protein YphA (DoxX/SURF4 family)
MRLPESILHGILARAALVVLRVYLGAAFLVSGLRQVRPALGSGSEALAGWGETLIGVCLLLGLLTRLVSALVLVMSLSVLLRGAWTADLFAAHLLVGAVSLALVIGAPGRTWGADTLLARRWPRSPFW